MADTPRNLSTWLAWLLGPLNLYISGTLAPVPRRNNVNLIGATITDNPETEATDITFAGGGGGGGGGAGGRADAVNDNTIASIVSTTYDDLDGSEPLSLSITTGERVLVTVSSATILRTTGGTGGEVFLSVEVSGATTMAAADANGAARVGNQPPTGVDSGGPVMRAVLLDGLTPGVNIFTLKARCDSAVWNSYFRTLSVQTLDD